MEVIKPLIGSEVIAAIIANFVIIITFIITFLYNRKNERKTHHREYLQLQAQPFLNALNSVLNELYRTTVFPRYYKELCKVYPLISKHADKDMERLIDAMVRMSNHRIELLFCINVTKMADTAALIASFITNIEELLLLRGNVWHNRKEFKALVDKRDKCADIGRDLLVEIRDSLLNFKVDKNASVKNLHKLSEDLREPVRESSVLISSFTSPNNHFWIGLWEVLPIEDSNEIYAYFSAIHQEVSLIGHMIVGKMSDVEKGKFTCYFIINFNSKQYLENFMQDVLPKMKIKNKKYWLENMQPLEINNL